MPVSRMKRYWHMKPNQVCRIQVRMRDSFPGKPCWPIWPNGSGNAASHPHGSPLSHSPTAQQSASAVSAASATSISSDNATESKLVAWQRRLAESSWAKRIPAWTERAIVVDVPGVGLVNGKLDAVFIGGLDPSSTTARFTVVDWKTGRRPTKPDDITRKLAQLDMVPTAAGSGRRCGIGQYRRHSLLCQ